MSFTEFSLSGLNLIGFSIIDYNNQETAYLIRDVLKLEGTEKYLLPVRLFVKTNKIKAPSILFKYETALMIDSVILFGNVVGPEIGDDMGRLFGEYGASLRRGEIYINNTKGLNCSFEKDVSIWVLGDIVNKNLKMVI